MQTEEIPNTDNNYNSLLKISSEEDLFVEDEVTGVKEYAPVTTTDVGSSRERQNIYVRRFSMLRMNLNGMQESIKVLPVIFIFTRTLPSS